MGPPHVLPSGEAEWRGRLDRRQFFFSLSRRHSSEIRDDTTMFEARAHVRVSPLKKQVQAYFHRGFWQPMDTLRDKQNLKLWGSGRAPWKTW